MTTTGTRERKRRRLIGRRPVIEEPPIDLREDAHAWWSTRDHLDHVVTPKVRSHPVTEDDTDADPVIEHHDRFEAFFSTESLSSDPEDFGAPDPEPEPDIDVEAIERRSGTNPFATLGIAPNAPWDDVVAAHRKLAKVFHPDLTSAVDGGETMREINIAYNLLRQAYGR